MRVAVVLTAIAIVVGACGGGDDGAATTTTVALSTTAAPTTTVAPTTIATPTTTAAPTTVATTTSTTTTTTTTVTPAGPPELPATPVVGAFTAPFKWGEENGEATVEELGFDPSTIEVHWYRDTAAGRWIAVFVGLDLEATGPLCPTSSFFGDGAQGSSFFGTSATPSADCEASPAGLIDAAEGGVRVCEGVVSLLTLVPTSQSGQLFGGLEIYPEGGTFYGVGGSVEADQDAPAVDAATLSC